MCILLSTPFNNYYAPKRSHCAVLQTFPIVSALNAFCPLMKTDLYDTDNVTESSISNWLLNTFLYCNIIDALM